MPWISETLSQVLRSHDVEVAHVPVRKLRRSLVSVKDKLPKDAFPGVVYKIPCVDCKSVYIGETGNFRQRMCQHQNDVAKKKVTSDALAEHAATTDHTIDWTNVSIIGKERNWKSRPYLESLEIQSTKQTLNRNDGNLPSSYARCLHHVLKPI